MEDAQSKVCARGAGQRITCDLDAEGSTLTEGTHSRQRHYLHDEAVGLVDGPLLDLVPAQHSAPDRHESTWKGCKRARDAPQRADGGVREPVALLHHKWTLAQHVGAIADQPHAQPQDVDLRTNGQQEIETEWNGSHTPDEERRACAP